MSEILELVAQRASEDEEFKRLCDKYKTLEDECVMPSDLVQTMIRITKQYNKNCERFNKIMATHNLVQSMITEQYNKIMATHS